MTGRGLGGMKVDQSSVGDEDDASCCSAGTALQSSDAWFTSPGSVGGVGTAIVRKLLAAAALTEGISRTVIVSP